MIFGKAGHSLLGLEPTYLNPGANMGTHQGLVTKAWPSNLGLAW